MDIQLYIYIPVLIPRRINLSSSLECSGSNIILAFGSEKTIFPIEYTGKLCEINKKISERLNWKLVGFTKQSS